MILAAVPPPARNHIALVAWSLNDTVEYSRWTDAGKWGNIASQREGAVKVHLVGSIGLDTVEEIFRTVGTLLGPHLARVPDGEVGGRRLWISWQYPLLRASPYLRPD